MFLLDIDMTNSLGDTTDHHSQWPTLYIAAYKYTKNSKIAALQASAQKWLSKFDSDVFLDDIAITFELSRKRNNPVDDEEKHKLISDSAKKILEKKKIW